MSKPTFIFPLPMHFEKGAFTEKLLKILVDVNPMAFFEGDVSELYESEYGAVASEIATDLSDRIHKVKGCRFQPALYFHRIDLYRSILAGFKSIFGKGCFGSDMDKYYKTQFYNVTDEMIRLNDWLVEGMKFNWIDERKNK